MSPACEAHRWAGTVFVLSTKNYRYNSKTIVYATGDLGEKHETVNFLAIYNGGLFIEKPAIITALCLIFEKVYLPNNWQILKETAKSNKVRIDLDLDYFNMGVIHESEDPYDIFDGIEDEDVLKSLIDMVKFCHWLSVKHYMLFDEVFETDMFEDGKPIMVELNKNPNNDGHDKYIARPSPIVFSDNKEDIFRKMLNKGYVPVASTLLTNPKEIEKKVGLSTAKELARLLSLKSIEMIFPLTKGANPEVILEVRRKLSDQLPPFWSAMLKLTSELKNIIREVKGYDEVLKEKTDIIDIVVRPSLIDLNRKLELERRDWFYKILSSTYKGLRLLIGNLTFTPQQLAKTSNESPAPALLTSCGSF